VKDGAAAPGGGSKRSGIAKVALHGFAVQSGDRAGLARQQADPFAARQ
jgi:hypothetical protein